MTCISILLNLLLLCALNIMLNLFLIFSFIGVALATGHDVFSDPTGRPLPDICYPAPLGGIQWILLVKDSNSGWGEHTAKAIITLAVNSWKGVSSEEKAKMELQLEEEVVNALMRNGSLIYDNDLALFIHALVATQKNPRNFHGIDLVADLLNRVEYATPRVHPFLVLALCNSHAIKFEHLLKIKEYLACRRSNSNLQSSEAEWMALALKASACAADLPDARDRQLNKFSDLMTEAANCLKNSQSNGNFGNVYTTSLAVQALTASGRFDWDEERALNFLREESVINVNMIKTYYIEMALNARKVKFIKDLGTLPYPFAPESTDSQTSYFASYSIKDEEDPDLIFSVVMKIPTGWNFFQVMNKASDLSNRFKFSYVLDQEGNPEVYEVMGKPNDAEKNLFWIICRQYDINHYPHSYKMATFISSPKKLFPAQGETVELWYRSTECPPSYSEK